MKALVWCGGDPSQYVKVRYEHEGKSVDTFLAPAALHEIYKYDKLIVIIPNTLFQKDWFDVYKQILEKKCNESDDKYVREILNKMECCIIPHPGIARPIKVPLKIGKDGRYERINVTTFRCSFNLMLNCIYICLRNKLEEFKEIHFDLTHGTNILVNALLIAGTIYCIARGKKYKFFAAPILGAPQQGQVVKFQDITDAAEALINIISGIKAWEYLDERLLPIKYVKDMGRILGEKYKEVFNSVRKFIENVGNLLWVIRSNQVIVCKNEIKKIKNIKEIEGNLNEIIAQEYLENNTCNTCLKNYKEKCDEKPWIPVADAVLKISEREFKDVIEEKDYVNVINKLIEKMFEREYYLNVIGFGREWIIYLLAKKLLKRDINIKIYENIDKLITGLGRKRIDEYTEDELSRYILITERLKMTCEDFGVFDSVRKLRNRLMHGRISKDEGNIIIKQDGTILKNNRVLNKIKKDEMRNSCENILKLLNNICSL